MKSVEIKVSSKIEDLHEDMIKILEHFGKFELLESNENKVKVVDDWSDEFYFLDRNEYIYRYEFDEKDEIMVKHCLNVAYDGDFLN